MEHLLVTEVVAVPRRIEWKVGEAGRIAARIQNSTLVHGRVNIRPVGVKAAWFVRPGATNFRTRLEHLGIQPGPEALLQGSQAGDTLRKRLHVSFDT